MKLKNKKTGEILETARSSGVLKDKFRIYDEYADKYYTYNSLAEVNAEWEDYEEPKEYWFIDYDGGIIPFSARKETATDKMMKSIGNYFDTQEEAEKAVEKLKAWKRLKDKGFKFFGVKGLEYAIDFEVNPPYTHITFDEYAATEEQKEFYDDLMLLFRGEE